MISIMSNCTSFPVIGRTLFRTAVPIWGLCAPVKNHLSILSVDLSGSIDETEDTIALLLDRMSALEIANNLQQEHINAMQNTIHAQAQTIVEQSQTIAEQAAGLSNIEEDVSMHDASITVLAEAVDDVEEGITALHVVTNDILDRLAVVEEVVIGRILVYDEVSFLKDRTDSCHLAKLFYVVSISVPWTACTSSPCGNYGTCLDVNVDTFICMCRDGYYGETCENSTSIIV